jgi:hydrogenase maturation protease
MARPLVVGYGNPSRRDDGFGWRFTEALRQICHSEEAEIVHCQQLVPELAEAISKARFAIFVDARANGDPGTLNVQTIKPAREHTSNTHHLDPAALLALAATLYGTNPDSVLVTVAGKEFGHGDELSPQVAAAMPAALGQVRNIISIVCDSAGDRVFAS